jgi:ferritin
MHAEKFFDFLNDIGGKIVLQNIEQPPYEFSDAQEILKKLEHEKIGYTKYFCYRKSRQ